MMSKKADFSVCPDCGRKTVLWAPRRNAEDNYYCSWHRWKAEGCRFYFFTSSGARVDLENEARWKAANGGGK